MRNNDVAADSWRASSHSGAQGNCVEVAGRTTGRVPVRDGKDPAGPVLRVGAPGWSSFVTSLRRGELGG